MLNIYIGKDNIPTDKEFIPNVNTAFSLIADKIESCDFVDVILKAVEDSEWQDQSTFIDRFGRGLYNSLLSAGTKALLCAYFYPDKVISFVEVGQNAVPLMCYIPNGNIWFPRAIVTTFYSSRMDVTLNGKPREEDMDFSLELGMVGY